MEAPLWEPKCVTRFEGEGGALLSIRHARGESRSSRSSSLVYPLLCTIDAFLSSFRLPSMSATFSAASDVEGARYTTGAAICGKALITSLLVQRSSKLYSIKYYVGNNVSKRVSKVRNTQHLWQWNKPQNSAPPRPCMKQDQDRTHPWWSCTRFLSLVEDQSKGRPERIKSLAPTQ
jgi:hypothetical protein